MVSIYPDFIRRSIILTSDAITTYNVVQTKTNTLECYLEVENDLALIKHKVKESILAMLSNFDVKPIEIIFKDEFHFKKR